MRCWLVPAGITCRLLASSFFVIRVWGGRLGSACGRFFVVAFMDLWGCGGLVCGFVIIIICG